MILPTLRSHWIFISQLPHRACIGSMLFSAGLFRSVRGQRFHAHFLSPERNSRRQNEDSPKTISRGTWSSTLKARGTASGWRFPGLAVARETSNVCVHPEKEREPMKCSLSDSEDISAEVENLGTLGPEELEQTWRALFGTERPRRVCG